MRRIKYQNFILPGTLLIGAFLRWYRLEEHLFFSGDSARDLLISINIVLAQRLPLVGPLTSLGWLNLGPFVYYLWALILWLGNLNPIAIAAFLTLLDIGNIWLIFYLSKEVFGEKTALIAAILYAASGYAIESSRTMLHASLMPFASTIFYLLLWKYLKEGKNLYFYLCCFTLSLLMQIHLTAIILLFILIFYSIRKIKLSQITAGIMLFLLPLTPLLMADYANNFSMIGKFIVWIPYRLGSALGIFTVKNVITVNKIINVFSIMGKMVKDTIFIQNEGVAVILFCISIFVMMLMMAGKIKLKRENLSGIKYVLTILLISFLAILIHNQPASHYFLFLTPLIILPVAYLLSLSNIGLILMIFLAVSNILKVLK